MEQKRILLGITGGIAAYKCPELVRQFVKAGIDVTCVMTEHAKEFVTPMTLGIVSKNRVYDNASVWETADHPLHIELAQTFDAILIAPATANFLGKMANGIADDLLSSICVAASCPVAVAPAMNAVMWENPATMRNAERLLADGVSFFGPADGDLACGVRGTGRMCEPEDLVEYTMGILHADPAMKGLHVLVTAGPTREAIDPVRFVSNRSSGKMGYAIARAAARMGAEVTLISGPTVLPCPVNVKRIDVETTEEMLNAALGVYDDVDLVFKAAAPADYTPLDPAEQKLHKSDDLTIAFRSTPDVLGTLGKNKRQQFLVGFAAETYDCMEHALGKMERKNLDMMVLNDVTKPGAGFDVPTNIVTVITKGSAEEWPLMDKDEVADKLVRLALSERAKTR